ncbi:MAG TPA: FxLYD domain-containing protein [Candidatus Moranbacteria bacterium]|nr:FxLYD domain-containing protein [Candidatus Moranbacteria bacterium]
MENRTNLKRMIVIIVYLIIFSTIALVIYLIKSPDPSCSDGKQNQAEKGIDCGGPCSPCSVISEAKDLIVQETVFLSEENNLHDVVAKIDNPNDVIGAEFFNYTFTLKDGNGTVIATSEGSSFILPADNKYIAKIGIKTSDGSIPASVEFSVSNVQWSLLKDTAKPQIGVYGKKFENDPAGIGSRVEGILRNESIYDLKKIEVVIVLRNENNRVVGINTTQRDSIRAKEQQSFQITWPTSILDNVQKIEVDPQINVFDSKNLFI